MVWGKSERGGDPASVSSLTSVQEIYPLGVNAAEKLQRCFVAKKNDGTIYSWGDGLYGAGLSSKTGNKVIAHIAINYYSACAANTMLTSNMSAS